MERCSLERFVVMCGSQAEAGRQIGVKRQVINTWLHKMPGEFELTITREREVLKVMRKVDIDAYLNA